MTTATSQQSTPPGFPKGKWSLDIPHSAVEFSVRHNWISNFRGSFKKFEVNIELDEASPETGRVEAKIEAASLSTGVERMETEVKSPSFLDIAHFSHITFKSKHIEVLGERSYRVLGDLTIRNITKETPLHVTLSERIVDGRNNGRIGFGADTTINRKEFGTTWDTKLPGGMPVCGDKVNIHIEGELVRPAD